MTEAHAHAIATALLWLIDTRMLRPYNRTASAEAFSALVQALKDAQ